MVASKKEAPGKIGKKIPGSGVHPLYGRPIDLIAKTGSLAQMKKMATTARRHVREVTAALARLDAQIKKGARK